MWTKPISALLALSILANGSPILSEKNGDSVLASKIYTYEGHSYCIYHGKNMSWLDTLEYCQKLGGTLVTVNTEEEQHFIEEIATDYLTEYPEEKAFCTNVNTGLYYMKDESQWTWIEEPYRFTYDEEWCAYTNWDDIQPDNFTGNDWYGALRTQTVEYDTWTANFGKWDDFSGDAEENVYFLCEWSYDINTQTSELLALRDMQSSAVFDGHSYQLINSPGNWYIMDAYCKACGGHLVSINSKEEQLFLEGYLTEQAKKNPELKYAVTGAYHPINDDSVWTWTDGSEFTYAKWYGNMPDNRYGFENTITLGAITEEGTSYYLPDDEQNYAYDNYLGYWNDSYLGYWNDHDAGTKYICEWDFDVTNLVLGDVDASGDIDIMDVIKINKFILGSIELPAEQKLAADVDGNGVIDSTDSLNIIKRVVELISSFDEV